MVTNKTSPLKPPKVGFVAGCMDLFHTGHVMMLKECRENCDKLIVFLQSNPSIDRPTKNIPVQTLEERRIQLEACKYVDQIIEYDTELELFGLIKKLTDDHPNLIRFLGDDYRNKATYTGSGFNIPVYFTSRNHGYSSTELRNRVIMARNRVSTKDIKGQIKKDNDIYRLMDNTSLKNLTVSTTELHPNQHTTGHKHDGLDEVYIILSGKGRIELDGVFLEVEKDNIILINEGVHHRLYNDSASEDLVALCIFQKYDR